MVGTPPPPPPPPPAPPAYGYGPPRRSFIGGVFRLGTLLGVGFICLLVGFYGALFNMAAQNGPSISVYRGGMGERRIAIIPIRDTITSETAAFVNSAVRSIIDNELTIGAVVLRVDSPGGSATASDEILHDIKRLRKETALPIIASYGGYAASGGYYVSCDADRIFVQPTTITGSIGVIAPYMTFENLLDKIGVTPETITSTAAIDKDTGSPFRAWTDKDRSELRTLLDAIQDQFVKVVAAGREGDMERADVLAVATGMPLMADDAIKAGLVDEIGYLDAALDFAATKGDFNGDPEPPVILYGERKGVIDALGVDAAAPLRGLNLDADTARTWMNELSVPRPMMLFIP
jgi:protease-4